MRRLRHYWITWIVFIAFAVLWGHPAGADDSCVFMVTADDVRPNIVFLLDNGANMEQITWHAGYNNDADYTPQVTVLRDAVDYLVSIPSEPSLSAITLVLNPYDETGYEFAVGADVEGLLSGARANIAGKNYVDGKLYLEVDSVVNSFIAGETVQRYKNKNNIATGTLESIIEPPSGGSGDDDGRAKGFFNENGYAIVSQGGSHYLVKILDNLVPDDYSNGRVADSGNTWTINDKSVTLPIQPSTVVDANGIKDNATIFRYSKNYLNWLFFYATAADLDGDGIDEPIYDDSALPDKSRFYYAKQALMTVAKLTANRAKFGIYNFVSTTEGASRVQPLDLVVDTVVESDPYSNILDPNYINNVNNTGTVTYSPLAEGLAGVGGYYASESSHVLAEYCQKNFVIIVSPGMSSQDQTSYIAQTMPQALSDHDGDAGGIGEGTIQADETQYTIPTHYNGSTWLDDVAHYLYTHDIPQYVGAEGFQNVMTYTVGFMGDKIGNLFLINTSNNGNGNQNLYDTTHNDYGKYHFAAGSPDGLSSAIIAALNEILLQTSSFTAPVVPVTRTMSGNRIYMAFFKPSEGNFWEGNVVKFGIDADNRIVDAQGNPATWPNGSIKADATPYWATKNWADPDYSTQDCTGDGCNYIENQSRNIYSYLGSSTDLTHSTNVFVSSNELLTMELLGNPTQGRVDTINYVRGADVLDEDGDGTRDENRTVITGDVLHSEPFVFCYAYPNNSSITMVYFGSNDGMLHAVYDEADPNVYTADDESSYGTEAWAFIPPDLLPRLKNMVEGYGHQIYVDSSPKVYFEDKNRNGLIEVGDGDQVILICGERKGGTSYFALDVTDPFSPQFLWRISQNDDSVNGSGSLPAGAAPLVIPELGQSWSEPQFGVVKTTGDDIDDGTPVPVFFIGGGYSADHSTGKAVLAIKVLDGSVVRAFKNDGITTTEMNYSFASTVAALDTDSNGYVDKVYLGDLGGQMWRLGRFTDVLDNPLGFPRNDENITTWEAHLLFLSDSTHTRKFFYPPGVSLEVAYDLLFMGTGDRDDACNRTSSDRIYALKDTHAATTFGESDLVDVTDPAATPPNLDSPSADVDGNGRIDQGWYLQLAAGEKVLSEGVIFYKAYYLTTFTPNDDPCVPGGVGELYALGYKTAAPILSFGGDAPTRTTQIGGGIPSKPVAVLTGTGAKLFVSVGSTNPDATSQSQEAGIVARDPLAPPINFFYQWWLCW